jgi:hypothetical protein
MRIQARVAEAPDGEYLQYRPREPPALISVQKGACEVSVANNQNVDITYKNGQCICRVQQLPEVYQVAEATTKPPLTQEDINIGEGASSEDVEKLLNILNHYRTSFADKLSEIGCTHLVEMKIEEKPGSSPVHSKPYATIAQECKAIGKIVSERKSLGIATKTNSDNASPVLLLKKKSAGNRLVIDYRPIKQRNRHFHYPRLMINSRCSVGMKYSLYWIWPMDSYRFH